jgi:hypothetical protein
MQHAIGRAVSEHFAHFAKVIETHQQRGNHPVAALRETDRLPQAVVEQTAVGQPGGRVVGIEEARRLLGAAQLGDIGNQLDAATAG